MQLENLFKQIATNTLNFQQFGRNTSTYPNQDRMPYLNMLDASFEF